MHHTFLVWRIADKLKKSKSSVSILVLSIRTHYKSIGFKNQKLVKYCLCYPNLEADFCSGGRYGLERINAGGQADANTASTPAILGNLVSGIDCYFEFLEG